MFSFTITARIIFNPDGWPWHSYCYYYYSCYYFGYYYPFLAGQETNISFTYEEARQLLVLRKPAVNIAADFTITISK